MCVKDKENSRNLYLVWSVSSRTDNDELKIRLFKGFNLGSSSDVLLCSSTEEPVSCSDMWHLDLCSWILRS